MGSSSSHCEQCDIFQKKSGLEFCCLSCRDSMGAEHANECISLKPPGHAEPAQIQNPSLQSTFDAIYWLQPHGFI